MTKILSLLVLFTVSSNLFASNFNKVLIVIFENEDFTNVVKQPYFGSLMKEGAILTNYHAETHPSQGNYIALVAGSMLGVKNDNPVNLNSRHVGDLLEEAGKTWKVYAEDYPGNCFLGATSGSYARKHVPFLSFTNVQKNPKRCANVVGINQFQADLDAQKLPTYSMYIPNLNNDGHNTGVAFGDKWLKANFDKIIHSSKLPKDLLIIITFDEGSKTGSNQIYTLLLGANVKPGASSNKAYDHYSTLKTIEDSFGLASLKQNDLSAVLIDDIWR
jgi:hypothetical protein